MQSEGGVKTRLQSVRPFSLLDFGPSNMAMRIHQAYIGEQKLKNFRQAVVRIDGYAWCNADKE